MYIFDAAGGSSTASAVSSAVLEGDQGGGWFGYALGAGDLEGDGAIDLAIGAPGEDDAAYGPDDVFQVDVDLLAAPGDRLVFAVNGDTAANGGIEADFDYAGQGVNFNNADDDIYVGVDSGGHVTTLDSVSYDELLGWPVSKGVSIELDDTRLS